MGRQDPAEDQGQGKEKKRPYGREFEHWSALPEDTGRAVSGRWGPCRPRGGNGFGAAVAPDPVFYGGGHLPDVFPRRLSNLLVRGVDQGQNRDPDAKDRGPSNPGGNEDDAVGSLQNDQVIRHRHQVQSWGKSSGTSAAHNSAFSDGSFIGGDGSIKTSTATAAIRDFGGNETRPKNVYVNWIIKAKHVIRSQ